MRTNKIIKKYPLDYIHVILLFIAGILVFYMCTIHIGETTNLIVWDELGYWGNAAYLAGYDWSSSVSANCGYYSYGYSLILSIIIRLFMKKGIAYQVAILLNAAMMTSAMYMAYITGIYYAGKEKRTLVLIFAVAVSLYGNNITQAKFAWDECTIIFLYWILVIFFISLQKKYRTYKLIMINITSIFLFFVHERMLAVLIACFLVEALMFFFEKKIRRSIFLSVFISIFLLVAGFRLQNYIKSSVYTYANTNLLANTANVLIPDTINKLNLKGIIEIAKCFLCRFFYWGCTTYFMAFVFFKTAIKNLYFQLKNRNLDFTIIFILLSTLGIFGIISITLSQSGSYQGLLYGRYPDAMLGPVFLLGLLFFMSDANTKPHKLCLELLLYQIVLLILNSLVRSITIDKDYFVANCNVDFYHYWIGTANGGYTLVQPILIAFSVFIAMMIVRRINKDYLVVSNVLLICMLCLYIHTKYDVSEKVFNKTFTNYENLTEFNKSAAIICKDSDDIAFYHDENWMCTPLEMWLQFEMYNKKIIDLKTLDNINAEYLFVLRTLNSDGDYVASANIDGELIIEDKYIALYKLR